MKLTKEWIWGLALLVLPLGLLFLAGILWLIQNESLWLWMIGSGVLSGGSWLWLQHLQQQHKPAIPQTTGASPLWGPPEQAAWQKVQGLSETLEPDQVSLETWDDLWSLLQRIMDLVAEHYYPEQADAKWEMPVPYLLKVIELAAADLRQAYSSHIPGSHVMSIRDLMRGKRLMDLGSELHNLYRLVSFTINPVTALMREARGLVTGKVLEASGHEVKRWLIQAYVQKIGYYAIELYSGALVLEDHALQDHLTQVTQTDLKRSKQRDQKRLEEPLRCLILGQVKAGKSSLVNALFGEVKALTSEIPATSKVEPYLLEREGLQRAVILDTAGYEDAENPLRPLLEIQKEVLRCDVMLMVCSATSAARRADRELIEGLKALFQRMSKEFPLLLVVLTHVDQVRPFREWSPPYNIENPRTPKEYQIRQAMEQVSQDLGVSLERIVPVNLDPAHLYNLEDGVIPAILEGLDEIRRAQYWRCLKDFKDEEHWQKIWEQTRHAGKLLGKISWNLAAKASQSLDAYSQTWGKQIEQIASELQKPRESSNKTKHFDP